MIGRAVIVVFALVGASALAGCSTSDIPKELRPHNIFNHNLKAEYDGMQRWILAHDNGVKFRNDRPSLFVTSDEEMQHHMKVGEHKHVAAFYNRMYDFFVFNIEFNHANTRDKGIAVHEGYHSMTRFIPYPCPQAREAGAYRVQELYYISKGSSMLTETGLTSARIKELTECL